ncbi:hypothetical protein [Mesorhizobium sp. M0040]|uniref:hypothetical protein n=1 Tax=Mesorhizobium sp. M0040 TaxID=2956855 RepID=UPI00333CA432
MEESYEYSSGYRSAAASTSEFHGRFCRRRFLRKWLRPARRKRHSRLPSSTWLILDNAIKISIAPWRSAMLSKATIEQSGRIAVLKVCKTVDLGGVMFRGWDWLGSRIRSFPRQTPLFISPQDTVAEVELDPLFFSGEAAGNCSASCSN